MDIAEYTKQQGTFLKAEDVKAAPETVWIITAEGEILTNSFGQQRLHLPLSYGTEGKIFDMSKTNARAIAEVLGNDTANWVNKGIVLETYRTKTTEGKMTDAINVKEVRK